MLYSICQCGSRITAHYPSLPSWRRGFDSLLPLLKGLSYRKSFFVLKILFEIMKESKRSCRVDRRKGAMDAAGRQRSRPGRRLPSAASSLFSLTGKAFFCSCYLLIESHAHFAAACSASFLLLPFSGPKTLSPRLTETQNTRS